MRFSSLFVAALAAAWLGLGGCAAQQPRQPLTQRDRITYRKLQDDVPLNFNESRLKHVFDTLRTGLDVPLYVDWDGLRAAGISQDFRVSLRGEATGEDAILSACGAASADLPKDNPVGMGTVDGVVIVALAQDLDHPSWTPRMTRPDGPASAAAMGKMRDPIMTNLAEQPLTSIISYLAVHSGVKIEVDWLALQEQGVNGKTPVSLVIGQCPADVALHLLVRQTHMSLGGRGQGLVYGVINGVMYISSPQGMAHIASGAEGKSK